MRTIEINTFPFRFIIRKMRTIEIPFLLIIRKMRTIENYFYTICIKIT